MIFAGEPLGDESVSHIHAVNANIRKGSTVAVQPPPFDFNFAPKNHVLQRFFRNTRSQRFLPASRELAVLRGIQTEYANTLIIHMNSIAVININPVAKRRRNNGIAFDGKGEHGGEKEGQDDEACVAGHKREKQAQRYVAAGFCLTEMLSACRW